MSIAMGITWSLLALLLSLPTPQANPLLSATDSWEVQLDLAPLGGSARRQPYRFNLVPVLAGDKVLVSSTLVAYAVDARTGELAWQAGPPPGWSELPANERLELFEGIDGEHVEVLPAVGAGIVVAALQIPWSGGTSDEWQGIEIMKPIPERRLFAFDLAAGRELWNHAPPPGWNGSSSQHAQRLSVCGPPVIAGERVLVPCSHYGEVVEYFVACYRLEDGQPVWKTFVAAGEMERNMFGKFKREFVSSPVVVAGDRVIAQTELGTVAALYLESGTKLWSTSYRRTELPKTRSYNTPVRQRTWRLEPPVIAGNVVLSTPHDSSELLAFDLDDGKLLWAIEARELARLDSHAGLAFDCLLGADEDTVFLGGEKLSALQKYDDLTSSFDFKDDGLASTSDFRPRWTVALAPEMRGPRPLLLPDSMLACGRDGCIVVDRETGEQRPSPERLEPGRIAFADDALFVLTDERLVRVPR